MEKERKKKEREKHSVAPCFSLKSAVPRARQEWIKY